MKNGREVQSVKSNPTGSKLNYSNPEHVTPQFHPNHLDHNMVYSKFTPQNIVKQKQMEGSGPISR